MAKEEFEALRGVRDQLAAGGVAANAACLMAVAASGDVPDASPLLRLDGGETVVGSLDVCNVRAVAGEVLIGEVPRGVFTLSGSVLRVIPAEQQSAVAVCVTELHRDLYMKRQAG